MISSIVVRWRWLRKKLSRTHWVARFLGIRHPAGESDAPGLIVIQIDGLSRTQMERAMASGSMKFLSRSLRRGHFMLEDFYSGVPSTTPAVQGEVFYGVCGAVPAFEFLHRETGTIPYERKSGRSIETALREVFSRGPLAGTDVWVNGVPEIVGNAMDSWRSFFGIQQPRNGSSADAEPAHQIILTAAGPLGHLYFPVVPDRDGLEAYARYLVATAGVPLVFWLSNGTVRAFNRRGEWKIARHFLGRDGPREERVAEHPKSAGQATVRVMTYNIHSCIGINGKDRIGPSAALR